MNYKVIFEQYHSYYVEADSEEEAFNKAHDEFISDMQYPIANTRYDSYNIECEDEEEDN